MLITEKKNDTLVLDEGAKYVSDDTAIMAKYWIRNRDYRIIFFFHDKKNEAVHKTKNAYLSEKSGQLCYKKLL